MSTPMFDQFLALKAQQPDAILFFRMGDFYETFFRDAEITAEVLDLTLTARNKKDPDPVPMAGVPHHAAAGYIQRMVDAGYRVAIADQVEDPALAKGLVRREVVRVVTPGVVLDPTSLAAREPNYLVAIVRVKRSFGVGFLDVSTGDLRVASVGSVEEVLAELHRLEPKEALLAPSLVDHPLLQEALVRHRALVSRVDDEAWEQDEALREIRETLGVPGVLGFGLRDDDPGVRAAGALLRYARATMGDRIGNVHRIHTWHPQGFMVLDDTTRRNLEIHRTLIGGERKGSLLALLDRTGTAMGSRLLREWLSFPLLDVAAIEARQRAVAALVEQRDAATSLRAALKEVADVERIGARIAQGTAHARDLAGLRRSLQAVPAALEVAATLRALLPHLPSDRCADVEAELSTWLVEEPPLTLAEGGVINRGVNNELDGYVELSLAGHSIVTRLEAQERDRTGISSLKVRYNKVFGFYIEVTRAHVHKVPKHYIRRQTVVNAERYITPELKEIEEQVLGADERRQRLELQLFTELRQRVAAQGARLAELAGKLAALDVLANLAEIAVQRRWVRPVMSEELHLDIEGGRHPVVEAAIEQGTFVANDLRLDAGSRRLIVLTGPNMSGKSTIMRQVALIVLLAQIGSFVPADAARIGLVDRIFTRVGAADDLARGQSTFMVEMAETAAILHHATHRSLVVLDEIGRGTSTYDGLSIAWAVAEDLVDRVGCRSLFATHYHELCELAETRPAVVNQCVAVSEAGDRILFLRQLKEGGASRSYGIQCARLAGLPQPVLGRARQLLRHFEKHAPRNEQQQLSLFGGGAAPVEEPVVTTVEQVDPVRTALQAIDPDTLTPREALAALYRLRELAC
jgi:DNA mismatch repair protein MutS